MKITTYSTKTCVYCNMLKKWFDDKGIEYANYSVDINPIAAQQMVQLSGQMGVPFTTIEKDDGTTENILGFDRHRLEELLAKH